jgi:hypothetical protein
LVVQRINFINIIVYTMWNRGRRSRSHPPAPEPEEYCQVDKRQIVNAALIP